MSRYNSEFHNLYLIYIPWHFPLNEDNITGASEVAEKAFKEQYPVLYAHLLAYKGKLENRNKEETGIRYEWYALQRFGSNYWKEYFKEKIAYRQISLEMDACLLDEKSLVNDKCYFVTGDHLIYLLCVFNSTVFNKIILQSANTTGNKGASFMSGVRVPIPNATTEKTVESLYEEMCAARSANNKKIEQEQDQKIDELISKLYGLTDEEIEVLNSIEA